MTGSTTSESKQLASSQVRIDSNAHSLDGRAMNSPVVDIVVQLLVSVGLGAAIGLERQMRGRAAGLRTVILVCLGATLVTMVSSEIMNSVGGNESIVRVDPGRIAAGIVTGIGFIGAGVIIKLGDLVRGVTTAATIWFVAGLGIAVGEERYLLATIAAAAGVVVLALLNSVENLIPGYIYRIIDIDAGRETGGAVLKDVREILRSANIRLMELKATNDAVGDQTKIRVYVRARQNYQALDVVDRIARIQGVTRTSWH